MATIKIHDTEYTLAGNLRVAYMLQNQHNHQAYSKVLSRVGEMTLEEQINMLYAAFSVANPEVAKTFTSEMFKLYILDHDEFNAMVLMSLIKKVISGILGKDLEDISESDDSSDAKN